MEATHKRAILHATLISSHVGVHHLLHDCAVIGVRLFGAAPSRAVWSQEAGRSFGGPFERIFGVGREEIDRISHNNKIRNWRRAKL